MPNNDDYLICNTRLCQPYLETHRVWHEPVAGMYVIILSLLHRLGIIKVPTEYRESEIW